MTLSKARGWGGIVGKDFVKEVTCKESIIWDSAENSQPFTVEGTNLAQSQFARNLSACRF